MNTPVSFEIAKLLKEKGFPQPKTIEEAKKFNLQFNWYNADGIYNAKYKLDTTIQAPTIADVVMWLYEKHEIWIEVRNVYFTDFAPIIKGQSRLELNRCISPTEAYSQAIEYTLKNLI